MKKLLICALLIFGGCATPKVVPQYVFPEPPAVIMVPPPVLKQVEKK